LATIERSSGWLQKPQRQFKYNVTLRGLSINHGSSEKAISITYSECVFVALVIQHAQRMRRIILSSVDCPAVPNFYTLPQHDFRKSIKCVVWFSRQRLSGTFLILRIIQRDIINVHRSWRKVPVFLARFEKKIVFFDRFFEIYLYIKFHENPPRGSRVFHVGRQTDRQTYMTNLIVAFLSFANTPKKLYIHSCILLWHSAIWHCVVFWRRKFQKSATFECFIKYGPTQHIGKVWSVEMSFYKRHILPTVLYILFLKSWCRMERNGISVLYTKILFTRRSW
jgi:hypothetical protein